MKTWGVSLSSGPFAASVETSRSPGVGAWLRGSDAAVYHRGAPPHASLTHHGVPDLRHGGSDCLQEPSGSRLTPASRLALSQFKPPAGADVRRTLATAPYRRGRDGGRLIGLLSGVRAGAAFMASRLRLFPEVHGASGTLALAVVTRPWIGHPGGHVAQAMKLERAWTAPLRRRPNPRPQSPADRGPTVVARVVSTIGNHAFSVNARRRQLRFDGLALGTPARIRTREGSRSRCIASAPT